MDKLICQFGYKWIRNHILITYFQLQINFNSNLWFLKVVFSSFREQFSYCFLAICVRCITCFQKWFHLLNWIRNLIKRLSKTSGMKPLRLLCRLIFGLTWLNFIFLKWSLLTCSKYLSKHVRHERTSVTLLVTICK